MGNFSSKQYYKYNPARDLTSHEQEVIEAGFPYVSTIHLNNDKSDIMKLAEHRHSSENTHWIVDGSIAISKTRGQGDDRRLRAEYLGRGRWMTVPADVDYVGHSGPGGCTFVEGHKCLSPTTAERFFDRETIVYAKKGEAGAFTTI